MYKRQASKVEIYDAFDACAEKVKKQLRRYKRKLKSHHKNRHQSVEFVEPASYTDQIKERRQDSTFDSKAIIVAETNKDFPIFSVKDAADELETLNLPFLLFKSEENKGVNILFRRQDGNLGWVQPS